MKTILGFVFLFLLGYLSTYHFRSLLTKKKLVSQFLTNGFVFILFGILLGPHFLNLFSNEVVQQLDPFIYLGLGWIGFIVGIQFEWRLLRQIPWSLFALAQLESIVSIIVLSVGLLSLFGITALFSNLSSIDIFTCTLILTSCGALSSSMTLHYYSRTYPTSSFKIRPLEFLANLHVFLPLVMLAFLYSFFHISENESTVISSWIWLSLHLALGLALGIFLFYLLSPKMSENERILLILGGIIFSAGVASYLHISPIVVCFIAGFTVANMPHFNHSQMELLLHHAERPIYMIMLILAGSLIDFSHALSWLLLVAFFLLRFLAKALSLFVLSKVETHLKFTTPLLGGMLAQGPLAIAMVIGFQRLYTNDLVQPVFLAILFGTMINELVSSILFRKEPKQVEES